MSIAPRSALFVPATSEKMLLGARSLGADLIIVDLEDAVAPHQKAEARANLRSVIPAIRRDFNAPLLLRVNEFGSDECELDLVLAGELDLDGLVVPKVESHEVAPALRRDVRWHPGDDSILLAGIESARGVAYAREIFESGFDLAYFGAEDLIADLGGTRRQDNLEVLYARSMVRIDGRLGGVGLLDQAYVSVRDDEGFRQDAMFAKDLGYGGKICLHPRQVSLANELFAPSAAEIAHARSVLDALAGGVGVVDGQMVDAVHRKMAEEVLRRAGLESDVN
ncbi:MAG: HpcH/HpaI aldolase/citrate lyase family protein [Acidimicrobiales bacterium]